MKVRDTRAGAPDAPAEADREAERKRQAEEDAKATRFGHVAMQTDKVIEAALAVCREANPDPEAEDAILSGAMTAITRYAIQRIAESSPVRVTTPRQVVGYFVRYVQRAAEILLNRPARPQA